MNKLADMDPLPLVEASHISDNRRESIKPVQQAAAANVTICAMEVFLYDSRYVIDHLSHAESGSMVVLLKIYSGGVCGRAELQLRERPAHLDLVRFASVFRHLKGLSPAEGLVHASGHCPGWGEDRQQLAEAALQDLRSKLASSLTVLPQAAYAEQSVLFECSQAYYSF